VLNTTTADINGSSSSLTDNELRQNQTSDGNEDVDDDNELPVESRLLNQSSSASPKYKREHRVQNPPSPPSSASAAADFQHTKFGVAITHHVTAFITWPQSPDVACSRGRKVVGYELRYRRVGDSDYISRYLVGNVALLDELLPHTRYRYQLQYVTEPPGESLWSQEAELDTTA